MHPGIQELTRNRDLGSSALLERFIPVLQKLGDAEILTSLKALQQAFPLMAVWYFAEQFFQKHGLDPPSKHRFQKEVHLGRDAVLSQAVAALHPYDRFLTISRSSLVEETLLQISDQKDIAVTCSLSLPGEEGRGLTQRLEESDVQVSCVNDWDLENRVTDAQALILGADLITENHIVNKWGTGSLVRQAQLAGKHIFVLAENFKRIPALEISNAYLYQDWSSGSCSRRIQVFEKIQRTQEIMIIPG